MLARALIERGDRVRVFDAFITGSRDRVPEGADLVCGDLRDPDAVLDACRDVEIVYHQGALRSVVRSVDEPRLTTECNVNGTLNVLLAAERLAVHKVIYASSSS